jgi:hypothetical protein
MALLAATVYEICVFVSERLWQSNRLSQFCQLKDIINFNDVMSFSRWEPAIASIEAGTAA